MTSWFKNPWEESGDLYFDWLKEFQNNITSRESKSSLCPSGIISLKGFNSEDLKEVRIIPEDGNPYQPKANGEYSGDGFYWKTFSDEKYWYKVSAGGKVNVKRTDTQILTTPETGLVCKLAANLAGKYYNVGWEPKSKPHNTQNPFDK
jgi:hypothetical protein